MKQDVNKIVLDVNQVVFKCCFFYLTNMFKLLIILFIIKLYAQNDIFKVNSGLKTDISCFALPSIVLDQPFWKVDIKYIIYI